VLEPRPCTVLGHAAAARTRDRYGYLYPGGVHLDVDRLGEVAMVALAGHLRTPVHAGSGSVPRDQLRRAAGLAQQKTRGGSSVG